MMIFDRRTVVVLSSLVGAMTVASGVLLMLEPRGAATVEGLSLLSVDRVSLSAEDSLFDTGRAVIQPGRWSAIVVSYGRRDGGGVVSGVGARDENGLGYHFVVPASGREGDSAGVEVGYRWRGQEEGGYWVGPESSWVNHHAIGVCVEDTLGGASEDQLQRLAWLVQRLQRRFEIPADRVLLHLGTGQSAAGTRWFPVAWFRQQLLAFEMP